MRGRKPLNAQERQERGTAGVKPREDVPDPVAGMPDCPDHVVGEARLEWDRMGAQLVKEGRMAYVYRSMLAQYCVAYGHWVEAERHLADEGLVQIAGNGRASPSPYFVIATRSWELLLKAVTELGISPGSASRVSVVSPASKPATALSLIQAVTRDKPGGV